MKIKIEADDLWGNLAGEDESPDVLESYFVDKPDAFADFRSPTRPLAIARARKGMGKSALLKKIATERQKHTKKNGDIKDVLNGLIITLRGPDLAVTGEPLADNPQTLIAQWQQRIANKIYKHIGSTIKLAMSDDEISAVEVAELDGLKARNIVSVFIDRLFSKVTFGASGANIEAIRKRLWSPDAKKALERLQAGKSNPLVWVIIDDIDATYLGANQQKLQLSTFFSACRALATDVNGLRIRTSVRTDVWADIRRYDEALDKVEQYIQDIIWSEDESRQILAARVRGYASRHKVALNDTSFTSSADSERSVLREVFEDPWEWGKDEDGQSKLRPPHVVIHTLSYGRPRWAAQLCKMAAKTAITRGAARISLDHVIKNLEDYGRARIDDIVREHRHQCAVVEELVHGFSRQNAKLKTDELLKIIKDRILSHIGDIRIDGLPVHNDAVSIARFLYKVGFLLARKEYTGGSYRHYRFEEKPELLASRTALDQGLMWEIHPCFRAYLDCAW